MQASQKRLTSEPEQSAVTTEKRPRHRSSSPGTTEDTCSEPTTQYIAQGQGIQNSGAGSVSVGRDLIIGDVSDRDADISCLAALSATDPREDKARIEDSKGGLLVDSYIWILTNPDFQRWRDEKDNCLLWIKGDPGKGKTMLLCGIINELAKSKNITLSYFFCEATDARINSATAVLQGLLYLLVDQQPKLIFHLRDKFNRKAENPFEGVNAWWALTNVFDKILRDPNLKQTYFIVDGLDECAIDLPRLLDFIVIQSSTSSRVKWIVSSRNWPGIEADLDEAAQQTRLCLELNEDSISAAVTNYIKFKVERLAKRNKYSKHLREHVLQHLLSNAQNTFLWVALVCQQLHRVNMRNVRGKLTEFPPSLDGLYSRMISQIRGSDDAELYQSILGLVSVVSRPITLVELESFINADRDPETCSSLADVVGECGSFLTLRENKISFVHQSARDYLVKHAANLIFPDGSIEKQHRLVVLQSIYALEKTLRRNIYALPKLDCYIDEISVPTIDPLAPILYASIYWVDHLCETESNHYLELLCNDSRVDAFLRIHFLHWLEALSLMQRISDGIVVMTKLYGLLTRAPTKSPLQDLVYDECRFLLSWKKTIEELPLQVYMSALIFTPIHSLTRQAFQKELDWIEINFSNARNMDWGANIQTLYGHDDSVESVVFSPDGGQIASGSYDNTIKIWDANTGNCLQTLIGHKSWVSSVAFSGDGKIASGSYCDSIKIWDVSTGNCLKTIYARRWEVHSVTFSNNSTAIIASASSHDGFLEIWNISDNKNPKKTRLYRRYGNVMSVAFSNDATRLASASNSYAFEIWDTSAESCRTAFCEHDGSVTSIAFSNDSRRLISGSDVGEIKIWDVTSGTCLESLQNGTCVSSVAFLHGTTRIISGSENSECEGVIKIWDLSTSTCLETLHGHDRVVTSMAVSNTGLIVSGSDDETIKIWDSKIEIQPKTPDTHAGVVLSLKVSSDGLRITGSADKSIKVWDSSGTCLGTIDGHDYLVGSVALSNDGRIASGSQEGMVKIWEDNGISFHNTFSCEIDEMIHNVEFCDDDSQVIVNGSIDIILDTPSSSKKMQKATFSKSLDLDFNYEIYEDWIEWKGQKIIWLPWDYKRGKSAIGSEIIAIAYRLSQLVIFKFSSEPPLHRFGL
ncbi:hypothetical protein TWF694_006028 [Orbilia ellipsospora]|uniref:NACHT domain-containing protein n=1 Tax=Orbilia ellipsospora TaxID=2528407 RepID=A0AAV9WR78_9PEZI